MPALLAPPHALAYRLRCALEQIEPILNQCEDPHTIELLDGMHEGLESCMAHILDDVGSHGLVTDILLQMRAVQAAACQHALPEHAVLMMQLKSIFDFLVGASE